MGSKVSMLVLSLGTSGLLLLAASRLSDAVASTPTVPLAFFALLPTLVSVNVVTEGHGWGLFAQSSPEEFAQVLEENMGTKVTAQLFFEALLSDACSFFRPAHEDSGTMDVDISAWRVIVAAGQSRERTNGYIRKQVFRMPLTGIPGVHVAKVEDFQYYALVKARSSPPSPDHINDSGRGDKRSQSSKACQPMSLGRDKKRPPSGLGQHKDSKPRDVKPQSMKPRRLEFGMKLFVPALPEGSQFSIEVLAIVEPAEDDPSNNILRILFASPPRHRHPETRAHAVVNPHVVAGVLRGLKQIWKQVAHTMVEICETNSDYVDTRLKGSMSKNYICYSSHERIRICRHTMNWRRD
uniref:Uncharacterized protein n=1 Tax=Phytophthora ramorum TaxID=164328 RepID=H3GX31_PHYRM